MARPRRGVDQTEPKEVLTTKIYGNPAAKFPNILEGGDSVVRESAHVGQAKRKAAARLFAKMPNDHVVVGPRYLVDRLANGHIPISRRP